MNASRNIRKTRLHANANGGIYPGSFARGGPPIPAPNAQPPAPLAPPANNIGRGQMMRLRGGGCFVEDKKEIVGLKKY